MLNLDFDIFSKIHNQENLYKAWLKAKEIYTYDEDFIMNREEIVDFEVNLSNKIGEMAKDICEGTYKMLPMCPLSLPKNQKQNGDPQLRQNFKIALQDQVVWIAIINILGPLIDSQIPFWSFGNRIYMPIWKSEVDNKFKFGQYTNSTKKIYRNWNSSWPLFRKAIYITAKTMGKGILTDVDIEEIEKFQDAPDSMKILYWNNKYWPENGNENIYYGQIDFKKFYPTISQIIIKNNILDSLTFFGDDRKNIDSLLTTMLEFRIYPSSLSTCIDDFDLTGFDEHDKSRYMALPTGLFVAGFLSNIALLKVDYEVSKHLKANKNLAHFRFVDDHIFIANSTETLIKWINEYTSILNKHLNGVLINHDKTSPDSLKKYFLAYHENPNNITDLEKNLIILEKEAKLDPQLPVPFLTLTLKKISDLNNSPIDIMDEKEKLDYINELEHILATEFPNEEVKRETRVSWAASKLTIITSTINLSIDEIFNLDEKIELAYFDFNEMAIKQKWNEDEKNQNLKMYEESKIQSLKEKRDAFESNIKTKENYLYKRIFLLLLKCLDENVCKPKIWKKLITFCRTTGYDGFHEIFEIANENEKLSLEAKKYICTTLIYSLSENLLIALKTLKSEMANNEEKDRSQKFINNIITHNNSSKVEIIKNGCSLKYVNYVIKEFNRTIEFIKSETSNYEYSINLESDDVYEEMCFLWHATSKTINSYSKCPCKSIEYLYKCDLSKVKNNNLKTIISKLLCMYPGEILQETYKYLDNLISNKYENFNLTPTTIILDNESTIEVNIFDWMQFILSKNTASSYGHYDTRLSEWTILNICLKIIKIIKDPKHFDNLQSLMFDNDLVNIHPANFYLNISEDIQKEYFFSTKPQSWGQTHKEILNMKLTYRSNNIVEDKRYRNVYYKNPFNANNENYNSVDKEYVYSMGVLLLNLLSKNFKFHPLINRGDIIEKSYFLLLSKMNNCYISSYTRAIIQGCLSSAWYEAMETSDFDKVIPGRENDSSRFPIKIINLQDLEKEIKNSISVLSKLQIFFDETSSYQLIPLSFTEINKSNNPFLHGGNE